jgi:hypothetical protein
MKFNLSKERCMELADMEGDQTVGAGCPPLACSLFEAGSRWQLVSTGETLRLCPNNPVVESGQGYQNVKFFAEDGTCCQISTDRWRWEVEAGVIIPIPVTACSLSSVRTVGDQMYLKFHPHGYKHPIELPVITSGSRADTGSWTWNGSLEMPTLRPSIRTLHGAGGRVVSHLWLNDGVCQHLEDSTDGLAGQTLPLIPLENKEL